MKDRSFNKGDSITAGLFQTIWNELKRLGKWSVSYPLTLNDGPNGFQLSMAPVGAGRNFIWARLTDTDGERQYSWVETSDAENTGELNASDALYTTRWAKVGDVVQLYENGDVYEFAYQGGKATGITVESGISARSEISAGFGFVEFTTQPGLVSTGQQILAYSTSSVTIPAGQTIQMSYGEGIWWIDVEDCAG